jgi:hypothetical protein
LASTGQVEEMCGVPRLSGGLVKHLAKILRANPQLSMAA